MSVKVLMSQLWPNAGGRTRAVMMRNDSIFNNINKDVEMYIMERTDDAEERILEAKRRFGTNFEIKDVFNQIRYLKSNKPEVHTNSQYVFPAINVISNIQFQITSNGKLVTLIEDNQKKMIFYSVKGFENLEYFGDKKAQLDYLIASSKVITAFTDNRKRFRLVNDIHGRLLSVGKYGDDANRYISERYFNLYGQLIYEFMTLGEIKANQKRKFYLYTDEGHVFDGNDSQKKIIQYLWNMVLNIQDNDTVIVDEPKFYPLLLKSGTPSTNRIFYFHWYNLGDNEKMLLQDKSVLKKVVFLTEYQKNDFLKRAEVVENNSLQTKVIDNFLEFPNMQVKRSEDGQIRILFVGRLSPEKNVQRTIEAFNVFYQFNNNAQLTVIGDGQTRKELEQLVHELGISKAVTFAGNILSPYESKYVEHVDVALVTPRNESYGLVYPELISRGIPVVTVDAPYGPRYWINNENGELLPNDASNEDISYAIYNLLKKDLSPEKVSSSIDIKRMNDSVISKLTMLIE